MPAPTVTDLALWLEMPTDADGCQADLSQTLDLIAQQRLTPEQLAALATARRRLAELGEAFRAMDAAALALSRQLQATGPAA